MNKEDKILRYVINELDARGCIDKDAYINLFGCKSWDEVANGIRKRFLKQTIIKDWKGEEDGRS